MSKEESCGKMKKAYLFGIISLFTVILDQLSKWIVFSIKPSIVWGFLGIVYSENTGAGFGILQEQTLWLGIISLLAAIAILAYYKRIPKDKKVQVLFALLLSGIIGNMIDRLFRGFVIDFFKIGSWPLFNIADAAITISVIGLLIYFWYEDREEKRKEKKS